MNCLYSLSSCTSPYRSDAAVRCGGDIAGTMYSQYLHCIVTMKTQIVVFIMVIFVWLVPVVPTQSKGEWSTAVMECGGLSVAQGLIQEMVKWCVDNLDTKIHVRRFLLNFVTKLFIIFTTVVTIRCTTISCEHVW